MDNTLLATLRTSGRKHTVCYKNNDSTISLVLQYKGQTPLRAMISDSTKKYTSAILLDYIQLVVFENGLKIHSVGAIK